MSFCQICRLPYFYSTLKAKNSNKTFFLTDIIFKEKLLAGICRSYKELSDPVERLLAESNYLIASEFHGARYHIKMLAEVMQHV